LKDSAVVASEDFISGWLASASTVLGRPVDLVFDKEGLLYISDDKANLIYILSKVE
jgi:glucose/arabinose dehydrogenase